MNDPKKETLDLTAELEALVPALRRAARARVGSPAEADDLVQDTIERALTALDSFTPGTNFRAWLYRIMHNRYISLLRQRKRRGKHESLEDVALDLGQAPRQHLDTEAARIMEVVNRLPAHERAALLLVAVDELTYDDAASVLNIRLGTVKSRVARARARLRAELRGDGPG